MVSGSVRYGVVVGGREYTASPDVALIGGVLTLYLDPGIEGMQPS